LIFLHVKGNICPRREAFPGATIRLIVPKIYKYSVNNTVFLSENLKLIVALWKFDVLKNKY